MGATTDDLLQAMQSGDRNAEGRFFERILKKPEVRRRAKQLLAAMPKARQGGAVATDDVILRNVFQRDVRPLSDSASWLCRLWLKMRHFVIDSARKGGQTVQQEETPDEAPDGRAVDPADVAAVKEVITRIAADMPNVFVFLCARIEGHSLADIAAHQGCSVATVHRALAKAAEFFEE